MPAFPTAPPVSALCPFAQVIVQSSTFSVFNGVHMLAASVTRAALSGTNGGQYRRVSPKDSLVPLFYCTVLFVFNDTL